MNELWILVPSIVGLIIIWIIYGYPIYAMLKQEKISLRKKEIELKLSEKESGK